MNINLTQVLGAVALALGLGILAFAYNASQSPVDQISETLTGRYTDQTVWYLLLGVVAVVVGFVLVLTGRRST